MRGGPIHLNAERAKVAEAKSKTTLLRELRALPVKPTRAYKIPN